jgi:hypothetical protein
VTVGGDWLTPIPKVPQSDWGAAATRTLLAVSGPGSEAHMRPYTRNGPTGIGAANAARECRAAIRDAIFRLERPICRRFSHGRGELGRVGLHLLLSSLFVLQLEGGGWDMLPRQTASYRRAHKYDRVSSGADPAQ